jgi:hypothetical protein
MKKVALLSLIMLLFLFSCKREQSASTAPKGKKYPVTFRVANLSSHQTNFAIRNGAHNLSDTVDVNAFSGVSVLYYAPYDNQFGFPADAHITRQDITMPNFGTVTDSLPAGNYTIIMIAGQTGLQAGYFRPGSDGFGYGSPHWHDTFWQSVVINVGAGGVSQDITLKRVVGKLEVNLTDAIPANADSLLINVNPETLSKWNFDGTPMGPPSSVVTYSEKIPASAIGKPNFTMEGLIGNTILSGALFSGSPVQSFNAKIDTNWTTNPTTYNW